MRFELGCSCETTQHLGYEKHDPAGVGTGNIRNGTRAKTVLADTTGPVELEVPRDRISWLAPGAFRSRTRIGRAQYNLVLQVFLLAFILVRLASLFCNLLLSQDTRSCVARSREQAAAAN